ncbi:MAG TPA: cytochrome P450 [Gaiellales bacterium]
MPTDPRGRAAALDPADPGFWALPERERLTAFAQLRSLDGPAYLSSGSSGFYALVKHADVVAASRQPELFLSGPGVTTPEPARWARVLFGDSMVNMDDPRHAALRRIVARAFCPRLIAKIEDDMRGVATEIVDDVLARRPEDFVSSVAAQMPYRVICRMMGIPAAEQARILSIIDQATGEVGVARRRIRLPGRGLRALVELHRVIGRIGRERRRDPADDLISALVTADVDGSRLNSRELGAFFSLLLVAGVETTRNAIAHGLALLTDNPQQRSLLLSDLDGQMAGAVEEIVRHSSPIIQFRRTLAREHRIGDRTLAAGDKVVLFYVSANRDETVFPDPDAFDITRSPNPHVGFGGGGPHFCLGAQLARRELDLLFRELYGRLPGLRAVGPPELVPSSFDNRVRRLPFAFDRVPARRAVRTGTAVRTA